VSRHRVTATVAALFLAGRADAVRDAPVTPGVSWQLAQARKASLGDIAYDLKFSIPSSTDSAITGSVAIRLTVTASGDPLILDLVDAAAHARAVTVDGQAVRYGTAADHIVIDGVTIGPHTVGVEFIAGDGSLNRNPDYLYTLFVPARAHSAFPCFDQPNLKARYTLQLDVPEGWVAVANGAATAREPRDGRATYRFAETKPISTYLFAFAAGRWNVDSATRGGRMFHMYHRETDAAKVQRNRNDIYDLVAHSLDWLERYTARPYPFDKYDFVLVPAFQYGGMEHPGAVFYNASGILLDSSATQNQLLGRASVIAHETAHMWFGDLVTMNWFDDVWTKEVFANFMAAKIANPAFPNVNHDLRFLTAHYPAAYAVDRTEGTNPIRQPLDNLDDAGTLYGAIIYEKAPIVMRQLEAMVGDSLFRDGLREYLRTYAYGNATWDRLIAIEAKRTTLDLSRWNRAWVDEPGRPIIFTRTTSAHGRLTSIRLMQSGPGATRIWPQQVDLLLQYGDTARSLRVTLDSTDRIVPGIAGLPVPDFVFPGGRGIAYGDIVLEATNQAALLKRAPTLRDDVARGAAWLALWDAVLDGRLGAAEFIESALADLEHETVELNAQLVLGLISTDYWRYVPDSTRNAVAPRVEAALWQGLERARTPSLKSAFFGAWRGVVLTPPGVARLERIWKKTETVPGVPLSESEFTALATDLALRGVVNADSILDAQAARITNPDRKARFQFARPALSSDSSVRAAFFATLHDPANRRHEPWVLDALNHLHHPLRARSAEAFIVPALEMLPEIQRTGDIFFPERWSAANLGGHNTTSAARLVRDFLTSHPDFPPRLRAKVLQAADPLYRSAAILSGAAVTAR
jgi:aminopeptidase N